MSFRFPPSLKALHSFEAAARLNSLTLAARELNVSVPAVAFQVRQVEDGLGVRLLRRHGRGVALTPEGRRLAAELGAGFAAIDQAVAGFRASPEAERVTVSTLASVAALWLLPRLAEFRAAHPGVDLRVTTSAAHADFAAGAADCAIRCGGGGWRGVHAEPLFPQRLAPLCSWSHPAAAGGALPPDPQLIVNSVHEGEWRDWFSAAGVDRAEPAEGQPFEGRELVADAVHAGLGVGLMDVNLCARALAAGDLVRLGPALDTGWTHWLVWPDDRAPGAACQAFMAWVLAEGRGAPRRPQAGPAGLSAAG